MIRRGMALLWIAVVMSGAASAQELRGFAAGGIARNTDGDIHPAVGGGATVDLGTPYLSAGGEAETFFSWPYFAGRGAVFGQGNFPSRGAIRAIVLGGMGFGEDAGPLIGGGVELYPGAGRLGVRFTIEDYLTQLTRYTCSPGRASCDFGVQRGHQMSIRAGVTF